MNSLRSRLIVALSGIGAVIVALGFGLAWLTARALVTAQFDIALDAKVRVLADLCRIDEHGEIYLDVELTVLPEFAAGPDAEYFCLRRDDGVVLQASPSLAEHAPRGDADSAPAPPSLPRLTGTERQVVFADLDLPDGRRGRAVGFATTALPDWDPQAPPIPRDRLPTLPHLELVVARGRSPIDRALRSATATLAATAAALVAALAASAWVASGYALAPLATLRAQVAGIEAGNLGRRLDDGPQAPRELAPLIAALDAARARLDVAFQRERRFVDLAAHELRTPLAELRAAFDVARRWPDDEAARARLSEAGPAVVRRLQTLATTLLTIARCDSGTQPTHATPIDVGALVAERADAARERHPARRITVTGAAAGAITAHLDGDLLAAILDNLLDNACAHAPVAAPVGIVVGHREGGGWTARIVNAAPQLSVEDVSHFGEPFWRKSRRDGERVGLGLTLCHSLASALGCRLEHRLVDGEVRADLAG